MMLTVKAAAERMGISGSLVYELCACGLLSHVRIGRPGSRGCIRITDADINAFLASQKIEWRAPARVPPSNQRKAFKHVTIPR